MMYANPQPNITSAWQKMTPLREFNMKVIPLCAAITGLVQLNSKNKSIDRQIEKYTTQLVKLLKTLQPDADNCYHFVTDGYSVTLEPTGLLRINKNTVIFTDPSHKILTVDEIRQMAAVTTQIADQPVADKSAKRTDRITPKKLMLGLTYSDIYKNRKTVMYAILTKAMKLGKSYARYYRNEVSGDYDREWSSQPQPMKVFRLLQLQEQNETIINTFEELNYCSKTASLSQQRYADSGTKAGNVYVNGMRIWIDKLLDMFAIDHTATDAQIRDQYKYILCIPTKTYIDNIFETADAIGLSSMPFDAQTTWANRRKSKSAITITTMLESECDTPSYDMLDLQKYQTIFKYPYWTISGDSSTKESRQQYDDYVADLKSCMNEITAWLHKICDNNPVIKQILLETAIYDGELETDFKTPYLFRNHNDVHELAPCDIQLLNPYVDADRWTVQPEDIATDTDLFEKVRAEYMDSILLTHGIRHAMNVNILFDVLLKLELIN